MDFLSTVIENNVPRVAEANRETISCINRIGCSRGSAEKDNCEKSKRQAIHGLLVLGRVYRYWLDVLKSSSFETSLAESMRQSVTAPIGATAYSGAATAPSKRSMISGKAPAGRHN